MTRLIEEPMKKLTFIMSEMGDLALKSITLAIDSYLKGENANDKVHEISNAIRTKYFEIEDMTFDIMLKYHPFADDFRLIRSSSEIAYAFSRLGRYAYDITQVQDEFGNVLDVNNPLLVESSKKIQYMVIESVRSFKEFDIENAGKIRDDEEFIDKIYRQRLPELIESKNTKNAIAEVLILRYLERIGDHAVFISDAVNYLVTGKHRPTDEIIASQRKPTFSFD